jgi:hypothetical protein
MRGALRRMPSFSPCHSGNPRERGADCVDRCRVYKVRGWCCYTEPWSGFTRSPGFACDWSPSYGDLQPTEGAEKIEQLVSIHSYVKRIAQGPVRAKVGPSVDRARITGDDDEIFKGGFPVSLQVDYDELC